MAQMHGSRRVALVTGGAKGIGLAIVRALLAQGHAVVAVGTDAAALAALEGAVAEEERPFLLTLARDLTAAGAPEVAVAATHGASPGTGAAACQLGRRGKLSLFATPLPR
jgi:NAD(P)-dependent dehydrogenase (short-subunit alcohol dehydrogenase family)